MPINSKPLTSARENRSNYNEWKSIWDSYKNSKDYQTLADYSKHWDQNIIQLVE